VLVSATVVLLSSLLMAAAAPGTAHPPAAASCRSFSRDAHPVPPLVRAWFEHSADERVVVCPQTAGVADEPTAPLYFGEGAVSHHGAVCSYLSHGLTLSGSGDAARLQRYERSEATDMAMADAGDCPQPHAAAEHAAYVETYDVTVAAFEGIMRLWSAAIAGPNGHCCAAHPGDHIAPEAREHIEAALGPDRERTTTVTRIVRIPGSVLRHRYAMFLTTTEAAAGSAALYVIYVDKALRGPYEISAFAETN
jgi:hypothetical protein